MRGIDGFRHSFRRRLSYATFGLLVALCAMVMTANASGGGDYIPRGQPVPQGIKWQSPTATGVNTSAWASWTSPFGKSGNYKFPVPVSAATIGGLFKGAAKKVLPGVGWYTAAKTIIDGAGWLIDELQGQVTTRGEPRDELGAGAWCVTLQAQHCSSGVGQMSAVMHTVNSAIYKQPCSVNGTHTNGGARYRCTRISDNQLIQVAIESWVTRPTTGWPSTTVNSNPGSDPVPVSNNDLGQLLKQHPEIINAIMIDQVTGAPIRTPELVAALNALKQQLEAANGVTTPTPDLVLDPEWADEQPPHESDLPGFCDWAEVVCKFIEWFKADPSLPDDIEVPYEERTVEWQERDSGLGAGTCPAPISAAVLGTSVDFGYEGICGFMEYMRPVAIACAWISAAFIVVNARPMRF